MSQHDEEIAMLRAELEGLMKERGSLLLTVGAAAAFVADLDSGTLPDSAIEAAELLASSLNELDEDCLREALELVATHREAAGDESAD
jgi:hypothetical protein